MKQTNAADAKTDGDSPTARQGWLRWGMRLLTVAFLLLVSWLLFHLFKNLDWADVTRAITSLSHVTLLLCVVAALASYFVYTGFELLGRYYVGHHLPVRQVMPVAFVCYAFNLNLGAWVGSVALRYRLYSQLGLDIATITRVLSFSIITNWLGYLLLAGILFSLRLVQLPDTWQLGATGLQWLGFALTAAGIGYLLACRFSRRREWHIRDHEIILPTWQVALLQAGLGAANWLLMAAIIFLLLPHNASYPAVLSVLLVASIAGVISHIPAGLGVLEAVFIALLQHQFSHGTLLAALIGYRAIYYLLPLAIALVVYLLLERNAKKAGRQSGS